MTSLQIKYFLTVAESMSFSQAAQTLYVSQPSVSRQIKQLEAELECTLFDRTRRNALGLTAEGMVYLDAFRKMRDQYAAARKAAREFSAYTQLKLTVGVGSGWDLSSVLMKARQEICSGYPQAEIAFESHDFQKLRHLVRTGELDAILCTKTSLIDFDGLDVLQIANLESRAYVRRGLLRPEGETLEAPDFEGQPLLMLSEEESPMAMELALLQFQARQVTVVPKYLPNRESILQALLLGEGVAVFDQYMRFSGDPRLDWYNLKDDIPICLVWNRNNHNPLTHMFGAALAQIMNP